MDNKTSIHLQPSKSRKRSLICAVTRRTNNEYNLEVWRDSLCEIHHLPRRDCCCSKKPYSLPTFLSEKKRPQERSKWQKLINRSSSSKNRKGSLFTLKSKMRVCSKDFIDKESTYEHPYPIEELRYDPSHRLSTVVDSSYHIPSKNYCTLHLVVEIICHQEKNTLLNDMTESEMKTHFNPCSSADLVKLVPSQHIVQSIVKTMTCQ